MVFCIPPVLRPDLNLPLRHFSAPFCRDPEKCQGRAFTYRLVYIHTKYISMRRLQQKVVVRTGNPHGHRTTRGIPGAHWCTVMVLHRFTPQLRPPHCSTIFVRDCEISAFDATNAGGFICSSCFATQGPLLEVSLTATSCVHRRQLGQRGSIAQVETPAPPPVSVGSCYAVVPLRTPRNRHSWEKERRSTVAGLSTSVAADSALG